MKICLLQRAGSKKMTMLGREKLHPSPLSPQQLSKTLTLMRNVPHHQSLCQALTVLTNRSPLSRLTRPQWKWTRIQSRNLPSNQLLSRRLKMNQKMLNLSNLRSQPKMSLRVMLKVNLMWRSPLQSRTQSLTTSQKLLKSQKLWKNQLKNLKMWRWSQHSPMKSQQMSPSRNLIRSLNRNLRRNLNQSQNRSLLQRLRLRSQQIRSLLLTLI